MPQQFDMRDPASRAAGLAAAVAELRAGGLVGIPTETVYGLAADASNAIAVARVFEVKGRPQFNPLIVHAASIDAARALTELSAEALALAAAFWPGPLTIVAPLRPRSGLADLVTAGLQTVAVRVPAHPVARELITAFGGAVAAPSANRSGHVSPTTARHVSDDLGDALAVILDAGPTAVGVESTIVTFGPDDRPLLLRAGGIPRGALEGVVGTLGEASNVGSRPQAPGMLASHYAPAVPLRIAATTLKPGESLLAFGPVLAGAEGGRGVFNLSATGDVREAAANLFRGLRELEAFGAPIAAMEVPDIGLGEAINDRLRRAAAPRS